MAVFITLSYVRNKYFLPFYIFFTVSFWGINLNSFGLPINIHHFTLVLSVLHVVINFSRISLNKNAALLLIILTALFLFGAIVSYFNLQFIKDYGYKGTVVPENRAFLKNSEKIVYLTAFLLPWTYRIRYKFLVYSIAGCIIGILSQSIFAYYQLLSQFLHLPIWEYTTGSKQVIFGILRLNALSGEPRHLGIYLAIGIGLILFNRNLLRIYISKKTVYFLLAVFTANLILTFSTSGILLVSAFIGFFVLKNVFNVMGFSFNILILVVVTHIISGSQIFKDRVADRIDLEYLERSEYSSFSIIDKIQSDKNFLRTGAGTGLSPYALRDTEVYKRAYINNSDISYASIRESNGIILYIAEYGYLGVFVVLLMFSILIYVYFKKVCVYHKAISSFAILVFISGIISYGPNSAVFFILLAASCFHLTNKSSFKYDSP